MPVIALPIMNAFMEGAAPVRTEPMANSSLVKSKIFLLSKRATSFPLDRNSKPLFFEAQESGKP